MEFITGRHIPRRTFIRGAGATVALPFLDAMVPAGRLWARAEPATDGTRLVAIELVHGLPAATSGGVRRTCGPRKWWGVTSIWAPAR